MRRWRKVSPARSRSGGPYGLRGRDANEIERARISMMARNATVPLTGRIQKRKTDHLRIVISGLQRAAGPYRWAMCGRLRVGKKNFHFAAMVGAAMCSACLRGTHDR